MTICTCDHPQQSHRYLAIIGDNTGNCLSRGCDCPTFEEA